MLAPYYFFKNFLWGGKIFWIWFSFLDQKPLKIKINYSNKNLNKNTNDSTFIKTKLLLIEKNINKEILFPLGPEEILEENTAILPQSKLK